MSRRGRAAAISAESVPAVLYGGPSDGQQVAVPYESDRLEHGGITYYRDPDPQRNGGARRYIAEGIPVHEQGGLASRLAAARDRAGSDRMRRFLALAPLIAEAYALGARIIRDPDGVLHLAEPHQKAPEHGEHAGLVEMVAARLRDRQSQMGVAITLLIYDLDELRAGAGAGLFDFDTATHGVIDLEHGRVWPFLPAVWRNTCAGCGWPVSILYPGSTRAAHLQCDR